MKKLLSTVFILGLLLLSSCQIQSYSPDRHSNSTASFSSNELIQPTSELFSLTGTDAAIYDAVVVARSSGDIASYVNIPRLSLVGTYQNDAGNTCYVCKCHLYIYDLENHNSYSMSQEALLVGEEIRWVCVTIPRDNGKCTEVSESIDGSSWGKSIRRLCGPLTELADSIIGNNDPEVIRNIPDMAQTELCQLYLESTLKQ